MKKLGFDLVLLGDSTAGKDTQALLLAREYKVRLAGSGAYLRKHFAKQYVQGGPAPTDLILPFLKDSLKNIGNKNVIYVGAARLKPEAVHLVKLLKQAGRDFFVLYIKIPQKEIIARSLKRGKRVEDRDVVLIKKRIQYYKDQVSKTVDYYKQMNKLKYINGDQAIPQVTKDILKAIHDYQRSQRN